MEHLKAFRNAQQLAYQNVPRVLDEMFGQGKWSTEKRPKKSGGGSTTWIIRT
jgi:hypothetical protein